MTERFTRRQVLASSAASLAGISTVSGCSMLQAKARGPRDTGACPASASTLGGKELVITHDIVLGSKGVVPDDERVYELKSQFARGQQAVWRINVVNSWTSEPLTDEDLCWVAVEVDDETAIEAHYDSYEPQKPRHPYWVAMWLIPNDYPVGLVDYNIRVVEPRRRRVHRDASFNVWPNSQMTVLDGTAEQATTAKNQ